MVSARHVRNYSQITPFLPNCQYRASVADLSPQAETTSSDYRTYTCADLAKDLIGQDCWAVVIDRAYGHREIKHNAYEMESNESFRDDIQAMSSRLVLGALIPDVGDKLRIYMFRDNAVQACITRIETGRFEVAYWKDYR